jgi:activator of HSP90 ATPase
MAKVHQEATFAASPEQVYRALMSSAEHARFTGAPAEISGEVGGTFSAYDGHVGGRTVELVPAKRIVQAWRAKDWPEGAWSIARFELTSEGAKTRLVFDQDGVPDKSFDSIDGGWKKMYWEKLAAYLK